MTNNPTNMNHKKREKLWKESINSDAQQFNQDHLKPLTSNTKISHCMPVEFHVIVWDMQTNMAELNRFIGYKSSRLDKWIPKTYTNINKH